MRQKKEGYGLDTYPNGTEYRGFYVRDKRQGFGIYIDAEKSTYSGSWYMGHRHGYGVKISHTGDQKYALFKDNKRIMKFTTDEATRIQDGELDLKEIADKPDCDEQFWRELMGLTDKFSALGNYDREEALFELKKGSLESRK